MIVGSKKYSKFKYVKNDNSYEGLSVLRGESELKGMSKSRRFDESRVKCFSCHKIRHLIRDFLEMREMMILLIL